MVEWKEVKFYKSEAENKKEGVVQGISVDMSILNAAKVKDDEVRVDFRYTADFAPELAKLTLYGYVIMGGEKKELGNFVESWEKRKTMPREISEPLANLITYTSQVNGVLISRAMNMPAPIIPPKVQLSADTVSQVKRK